MRTKPEAEFGCLLSPAAILKAEKALGMRLSFQKKETESCRSKVSKETSGNYFNHTFVQVMSIDTAREMYWQSTARSTIGQRCEAIFNQEFMSDVKFVVRYSQGGSENKTIPAHKFVLAISSPVFYAMFYGELAEKKNSVEVSDCEYESMLELFRFIYSDEVIVSPDNVLQLLYLAKKYMLPSLAEKCCTYLQENVDATTVFYVLPDAQKYKEKDLLDHCWKVIEKETDKAVKSESFVTIERSVLEELVEKDSLNIKEVELFKAVDCWAEKKCERQGLIAEGSAKRRILGERIVKGIRFPVMEEKEFTEVVLDSEILTHEETDNMMKYFNSLNSVLNLPVEFSATERVGRLKIISRFRSVNRGWQYYPGYLDCLALTVDKNINLHAVRLFGSDNSEYSVTLEVYKGDSCVATEKGKFLSNQVQSEIGDYQGFDVVFNPSIALEANTQYKIHASITGSPSWYGKSGCSTVEHSGVKFHFSSFLETSTSSKKGQFPEFVFILD